jgi:hypothetical protein
VKTRIAWLQDHGALGVIGALGVALTVAGTWKAFEHDDTRAMLAAGVALIALALLADRLTSLNAKWGQAEIAFELAERRIAGASEKVAEEIAAITADEETPEALRDRLAQLDRRLAEILSTRRRGSTDWLYSAGGYHVAHVVGGDGEIQLELSHPMGSVFAGTAVAETLMTTQVRCDVTSPDGQRWTATAVPEFEFEVGRRWRVRLRWPSDFDATLIHGSYRVDWLQLAGLALGLADWDVVATDSFTI